MSAEMDGYAADFLPAVQVGAIYEGVVVRVLRTVAVVRFLDARIGSILIPDLAQDSITNVTEVLREGDEIRVRVLSINEDGKFRLSMKGVDQRDERGDAAGRLVSGASQALPDWAHIEEALLTDLALIKSGSKGDQPFEALYVFYKEHLLDAWPTAQEAHANHIRVARDNFRNAKAQIDSEEQRELESAKQAKNSVLAEITAANLGESTEDESIVAAPAHRSVERQSPIALLTDARQEFLVAVRAFQEHRDAAPKAEHRKVALWSSVPILLITWIFFVPFVVAVFIAVVVCAGWFLYEGVYESRTNKLRLYALVASNQLRVALEANFETRCDASRERSRVSEAALRAKYIEHCRSICNSLVCGEKVALRVAERWNEAYVSTSEAYARFTELVTADTPKASETGGLDFVLIGSKKLPAIQSVDESVCDTILNALRDEETSGADGIVFQQRQIGSPPGPQLHRFANGRPLLIRAGSAVEAHLASAVSAVILRCLAQTPPGKLLFTFIDPVGQGQNAARLLRLADHDENLVNTRAFSGREDIKQQLKKLTQHIENVIQKYLRTEFATIEEFNVKAGEIAEPYLILVLFDFPDKFDEECVTELRRILQNGPRCGVFTILVQDKTLKSPYGTDIDAFSKSCVTYDVDSDGLWIEHNGKVPGSIIPAQSPPDNVVTQLVDRVGAAARESSRVEVPYERLMERAKSDGVGIEPWSSSAAAGIRIPLGPTGARKVQYLELGTGLSHHALVAGRPGSGKSNLMHIIISGAARIYSPSEIRLYLVDFKKGVEFQPYAQMKLPHAEVVAVDSEREFGVSVLRGLKAKMEERNDLFSRVGVPDLLTFREKNAATPMPRALLLVDEFQEFFAHDDALSREAALLLDQLVRMGRSAGIHVLLGSQTLAGAHSLPRATMNLMAVRIALQCSDADSRLILGEENPGARQLRRPGEGIYNAGNGNAKDNNFFQVALFKESDREACLSEVRLLADRHAEERRPIVFKGQQPADLDQCTFLTELRTKVPVAPRRLTAWLGEAIAIRPPISVEFTRQGATNLIVVSRDEAEGIGLVAAALVSLAAHPSAPGLTFHVVDLSTADREWHTLSEWIAESLPGRFEIYGRRDLPGLLEKVALELDRRTELPKAPLESVFLIVIGLQRARDLRLDDGNDDAIKAFARILREGPEVGIHTMAWVDGIAGLERSVDRRTLGEFGLRCAGALDSRGSDILFDSDIAAKLAGRPHRMVLSDESAVGVVHMLRPYEIPSRAWIEAYGADLNARDDSAKKENSEHAK